MGPWSGRVDLNHRSHGPKPCALPSYATPRVEREYTQSAENQGLQRQRSLKRRPQGPNGLCTVTDMVFESGIHFAERKRVTIRGKQRVISKTLGPARFRSHGSTNSA